MADLAKSRIFRKLLMFQDDPEVTPPSPPSGLGNQEGKWRNRVYWEEPQMFHVGTPYWDELAIKSTQNVTFLKARANGGAFKACTFKFKRVNPEGKGVGGGHNKLFVREKARCIF